ncbi:hypothetical protein EJD97_013179 [Solanum chilense]|uniref:Uncharacterized protein n=1 Tax=Solanum chilense TaxID=4083 RepID=A0A6N2BK34_SOLCI|nr:hypothetical protein EJD97_013179 [Solanum chilense]
MIIAAPPQLKMWYDNLERDHGRTLYKYVGALTELITMNGWPKLVEVLTRDCIDTVGTGIERKARKQEDIFIPNKPSVEDITDWLGWGKILPTGTKIPIYHSKTFIADLDMRVSTPLTIEISRSPTENFGRRQTLHEEAYYDTYIYDIGDDRVHEASEMFREWKGAKRMDKDTIAPDRFNAGYDEGYEKWLKDDIQSISTLTPRSFRSLTNNEAKAVVEL